MAVISQIAKQVSAKYTGARSSLRSGKIMPKPLNGAKRNKAQPGALLDAPFYQHSLSLLFSAQQSQGSVAICEAVYCRPGNFVQGSQRLMAVFNCVRPQRWRGRRYSTASGSELVQRRPTRYRSPYRTIRSHSSENRFRTYAKVRQTEVCRTVAASFA